MKIVHINESEQTNKKMVVGIMEVLDYRPIERPKPGRPLKIQPWSRNRSFIGLTWPEEEEEEEDLDDR
jgi:hypothetical protein